MNIDYPQYIFVFSYPNTPEKIDVLRESVSVLKMSGYPIVSISNFQMGKEILSIFDDHFTGTNEECCFENFFESIEIDKSRNNSRFLLHFDVGDGHNIFYKSFGYGRGCTYHWSALNQLNYIIDYCKDKNIKYVMLLEGDSVLDFRDIQEINKYFYLMSNQNLKFIISTSKMFEFMSGNVWFFDVEYVTRIFLNSSCEDFLRSTYPNFSAESYLYNRLLYGEGKGKILVSESDNMNRRVDNCIVEKYIVKYIAHEIKGGTGNDDSITYFEFLI